MEILKKLAIADAHKAKELDDAAREIEQLLDAEMKEAQGGCWECDSYCKACVSGNK